MNAPFSVATSVARKPFVLRFASLFSEGRALAFPCDEQGHVDLDALPERARGNYFFARALVGRDFAVPRVCHTALAA